MQCMSRYVVPCVMNSNLMSLLPGMPCCLLQCCCTMLLQSFIRALLYILSATLRQLHLTSAGTSEPQLQKIRTMPYSLLQSILSNAHKSAPTVSNCRVTSRSPRRLQLGALAQSIGQSVMMARLPVADRSSSRRQAALSFPFASPLRIPAIL